jgi:hypothetical protein
MADLSTLRAAKQALDEQLITQQDFDCVKVAFLRAQQIKAGLDAGFIKQEAYERASDAYLHALDFQLMSSLPSLSAAPASVPAPGSSATPAQSAQPVSRSQSAGHTPAVVPAPAPAAAAPAAAAPPRPSGASTGPVARPLRNSNSSSSSLLGAAANGDTQPNSPLSLQGSDEAGPDIPADLPDYCKGASRGKVGSDQQPLHSCSLTAFPCRQFGIWSGNSSRLVLDASARCTHEKTNNTFPCLPACLLVVGAAEVHVWH